MTTKKIKSEAQWQELEQCFKALQQENPEAEGYRVLIWTVVDGRFGARVISRAVNRLVNENDYCHGDLCRGECMRFHDKRYLKNYLLQWAHPAVMKMVRLTKEEVMVGRANASH